MTMIRHNESNFSRHAGLSSLLKWRLLLMLQLNCGY